MSLTSRDRKIVLALLPLVVIIAYWFLLLAPKREEAATAGAEQTTQQQRLDVAQRHVDQLSSAKTDFAADYAELVRLGKAVPESVDMPTLLVQLQAAADGTGVSFTSISADNREPAGASTTPQASASATPPAQAPAAPGQGNGSQPAAAGGTPAQSGPGKAAETAGNTVGTANNASKSAEQSGVNPSDTQTSAEVRPGSVPVGGGTADPAAATSASGTSGVAGLDAVPLKLEFDGNFFGLANFFHRLKRYVETSNHRLLVRGRLLTIDGISFTSDPETFPKLSAEITATAYLAPATEGATAGASPSGPSTTPASEAPSSPTPTPTAPAATATR